MRTLLVLTTLLLVGSTPVRAGWSISLGGIFDWGAIGFSYGEGCYGSNWSVSYGYYGYGCPGYSHWNYLNSCYWPSYPYYRSYGYGTGYYGYSSPTYCYSPTYYYSPRYYSSYPSYGGGYYSSRPRYTVEGRHDSHDYRGGSSGYSRGYSSAPPPARYSGERSSPPSAVYFERDRSQQVYWNSRTNIGGSPSMGNRPSRAPPVERSSGQSSGRSSAPSSSGGDRGARYGR